jgi:hypothetical protein
VVKGWDGGNLGAIPPYEHPHPDLQPLIPPHPSPVPRNYWISTPYVGRPADNAHGAGCETVLWEPMDLEIASIVVSHDATLLSRNLVDFRRVAGLQVEGWTA